MMRQIFARVHPAILALLLISLPHLLFVLSQWHAIPLADGVPVGSTDTDPWLRLTLVREWITSGDWYNHYVPRSNAPFAETISPWTRPLDMVIAAVTYLQPHDVPLDDRLMRAALLLPWLWMTLLLAGMFSILRRLAFPPSIYLMAGLLVATTPIIWNYFGSGNADHHAPLAVLFMWTLAGVLQPTPTRLRMLICGILLGLQLWISVEAAILIGLICAWYGLNWLRGEQAAMTRLAWMMTSVAFTSLVALMIEFPREQWFIPLYDANSIVYVALMTLAALLAWQLHFSHGRTWIRRALLAAIYACIVFGFFFALFPRAMFGPMADVSPYIKTDFLPRIAEAKPLVSNGIAYIIGMCIQPMAALLLFIATWRNAARRLYASDEIKALSFFVITLFVMYVSQQRWSYYAYPVLALAIAPFMAALFEPEHASVRHRWPSRTMLGLSPNAQMLRRLPLLLVLIGLPIGLILLNTTLKQYRGTPEQRELIARREACYTHARQIIRSHGLDTINGKSTLTLLAPTDLGTEILFFTHHRIIASNYHREGDGIKYVWEADALTKENELRRYLATRGVEALLICPMLQQKAGSILQDIANGNPPPPWLKSVSVAASLHASQDPSSNYSSLSHSDARLFIIHE